jgi:hypothetical protein
MERRYSRPATSETIIRMKDERIGCLGDVGRIQDMDEWRKIPPFVHSRAQYSCICRRGGVGRGIDPPV